MAQKTKTKRTTAKKGAIAGRRRKKAQAQPEEMIRLLKEVDDHLSSLSESYNQYQEAAQKVMRKLDQWEERFGQFDAIASRLKTLESEVGEITRGYLERIEALEKRQANIEAIERRVEQEAA